VAVEYALAVALIALALLNSLGALQGAVGDRFDDRTGAGAPDVGEAAPTIPPLTPTTQGQAPTTVGSSLTASVEPTLTSSVSSKGAKWSMTVTVTVLTPEGDPVIGATVTGVWEPGGNGDTSCVTSSPNGVCSVTQDQMKLTDVPSATMTLTSVTDANGSVPSTAPTITAGP
jgi:hypothetical protein